MASGPLDLTYGGLISRKRRSGKRFFFFYFPRFWWQAEIRHDLVSALWLAGNPPMNQRRFYWTIRTITCLTIHVIEIRVGLIVKNLPSNFCVFSLFYIAVFKQPIEGRGKAIWRPDKWSGLLIMSAPGRSVMANTACIDSWTCREDRTILKLHRRTPIYVVEELSIYKTRVNQMSQESSAI